MDLVAVARLEEVKQVVDEPGLYFKDFGVRTEINMVWTGAGPEVTGPRQASIVTLV